MPAHARELACFVWTRGFRRVVGVVLPENRLMLGLANNLGFSSPPQQGR